jgi:DNA-binding XRE family transcriptional regulator
MIVIEHPSGKILADNIGQAERRLMSEQDKRGLGGYPAWWWDDDEGVWISWDDRDEGGAERPSLGIDELPSYAAWSLGIGEEDVRVTVTRDDAMKGVGVELKAGRELLGLGPEAAAELLDVSDRTYRAWEAGKRPIPHRVRDELAQRIEQTWTIVDRIRDALKELSASAGPDDLPPAVVAYRGDKDYRRAHPRAPLTARWWRTCCVLAASQVPGAHVIGPDGRDLYRVIPIAPPSGTED